MPALDLVCVRCGYRCDTSECPEEPGAVPQQGDITICINCGQLYLLDANWVPMSEFDIARLHPAARAYLESFQQIRRLIIREDLALKQKFSSQ